MLTLADFLADVRSDIDAALEALIPSADVPPTRLHEAIRWSVFAGGKRLRPALVVAVGETFGASRLNLARTAAAVEMIHTYSLIHDDLPAMDDDDLRRGRATCHKQFAEATAILAGDVLQTLAFRAVATDETLSPEMRVKLIALLADAAGTPSGMVAGQQLDLDAEGETLAFAALENIHQQKTGALITASALAGAIIGEANEDEVAAIKVFAERLGLLFQITDDLLDVTEETAELGKTAGKDAAAAKATYPGHYGVERSRELAEEIFTNASAELDAIPRDTSLLHSIAEMIATRKR
ncbi:MAG: polyprenyl synthetase family protein [Pyrinomonadaceae bacterium]